MPSILVCDVALDPRKGGSDAVWTYRSQADLAIGDAVVVPLGTRSELGYVLRIYEADEFSLGFPLKSLRNITGKVFGLSLPETVVKLIGFTAWEYLCSEATALAPALPPGVKDRIVTEWRRTKKPFNLQEISPPLQEVLRVIDEELGVLKKGKEKNLSPSITKALKALMAKGLVERSLRIKASEERTKSEPLYRLTSDGNLIEKFLHKEGRRKPAQAVTVMRLQSSDRGGLSIAEIKALASVTEASVKALIQAKLLELLNEEVASGTSRAPSPNPAQQIAIDAVTEAVVAHRFASFLLFGVTGSGKTEVFLRSAAEALRQGKSVLYLVPEIALAAQAIGLLRDRFGKGVAILHSSLSPTERFANWFKVRDGSSTVVLGARSALFAPISNLGLIILDEEHEQAYKQEAAPRYHAKKVAMELAKLHRCPILLGSATPSIESFFEAETFENSRDEHGLTLLTLPERAAESRLPKVLIKDLSEDFRQKTASLLSAELREGMVKALENGNQIILFLNRRAYSPFILCRDCGKYLQCPNCSVSLSYHRTDNRLRCHHCGYHTHPPQYCSHCGSERISAFGAGTEKVEEAVRQEFPSVTIGRLDRDVVRQVGALEETLANFRSGEISILVGTQMIAKGLDFPNVTLVGVIAADVSLNIPDFRASERTFQLLSQVGGRAGRGSAPGTVIVQTFNPTNSSILAAQSHDFLPFYELTKAERRAAGYPPFRRLVNILVSGEVQDLVAQATFEAAETLIRRCPEAEVLGPVECSVERAFGKWRRHVLIKLGPDEDARKVWTALKDFDVTGVQLVIDVDPYSMM